MINAGTITDPNDIVTKGYVDTATGLLVPKTYLDTDGTLAANSDTKVATQKAVKTYVDTRGRIAYVGSETVSNSGAGVAVVSINATTAYKKLYIRWGNVRSLYTAVSSDTLRMQYNSDTANHYSTANGSQVSSFSLGQIPSSNSSNTIRTASGETTVTPHDSAHSQMLSTSTGPLATGTASGAVVNLSGVYDGNVATFVSIQLFANAGNLADGSWFIVEGLT